MKKVAIFLTVFAAAFASEEFNQALRLENDGKIKEAMLIYKKLALDAERIRTRSVTNVADPKTARCAWIGTPEKTPIR